MADLGMIRPRMAREPQAMLSDDSQTLQHPAVAATASKTEQRNDSEPRPSSHNSLPWIRATACCDLELYPSREGVGAEATIRAGQQMMVQLPFMPAAGGSGTWVRSAALLNADTGELAVGYTVAHQNGQRRICDFEL